MFIDSRISSFLIHVCVFGQKTIALIQLLSPSATFFEKRGEFKKLPFRGILFTDPCIGHFVVEVRKRNLTQKLVTIRKKKSSIY